MKTKMIIQNGETRLILTPENAFDSNVIEKMHDKKDEYDFKTTVEADHSGYTGRYTNHKIVINITSQVEK